MTDDLFRLDAYLERIDDHGPLSPSVETLRRLHRAQMTHIPFENIALFEGQPIQIDPTSIFTKLVERRRGGYCHEMNGLFSTVLRHLGFTVTNLAAHVFHDGIPAAKGHRLSLVEIEGKRWLADVGFGGNCLIEAIPFELDQEFPQYHDTFRLKDDPQYGFVLQHKLEDQWRTLYAFSLAACYDVDYRMMNYYTSTSPDSTFTQHIICTITTEENRIILFDDTLKIRSPKETITLSLEDKDTYREALQRYFGIVLSPGTELQSPFSQFRMLL